MNVMKLLLAAAGGAALWRWAQHHKEHELHRRLGRAGAKPHDETRWEGEGGALRHSGPQVGPSPELP